MMRIQRLVMLVLAVFLLVPQQAFAYSYGDPSQETIAEALKDFQAKLSGDSQDWQGVAEIFKVHRSEIESHFGASVTSTFDANIAAKDKDLFLANYKALLVMNLERRFDYAVKDFEDYSQAKLLLAKAKGTYDVLQPHVKSDVDTEVTSAFDIALEALGNPGLFGVGEKASDPETFKKETSFILGKMKPLFPFKEAKPAPVIEPPKQTPAKQQPVQKPSKPAEPPAEEPKDTKKPAAETEKNEPAEKPSEGQPAQGADTEPADTEPAEMTDPDAPVEQPAETSEEPEQEVEAVPEPAIEEAPAEAAPETAVEAAGEHAPMERTNRTNPIVSVVVIGAVVLAAAGGIWFAKKQKLF